MSNAAIRNVNLYLYILILNHYWFRQYYTALPIYIIL